MAKGDMGKPSHVSRLLLRLGVEATSLDFNEVSSEAQEEIGRRLQYIEQYVSGSIKLTNDEVYKFHELRKHDAANYTKAVDARDKEIAELKAKVTGLVQQKSVNTLAAVMKEIDRVFAEGSYPPSAEHSDDCPNYSDEEEHPPETCNEKECQIKRATVLASIAIADSKTRDEQRAALRRETSKAKHWKTIALDLLEVAKEDER